MMKAWVWSAGHGRMRVILLLLLSLLCGAMSCTALLQPEYKQRQFQRLLARARDHHDAAAALALWNSLDLRTTSSENGAVVLIVLVEPQIRLASPCTEGKPMKLALEPAFDLDWGTFFGPRGDVLSIWVDGFPVPGTSFANDNVREIGCSTTLTLPPLSAGTHTVAIQYNVWVNMSVKVLTWPSARRGLLRYFPAREVRHGGFKGTAEGHTTIQVAPRP